MEMKIAIRVDVVQVLAITQCLQQEDQEARLAGSAACLRDRGLPLDWPILLRSHPEIWAGAPLVLQVPARIGDRPRGTPPADCDLTTAEVLMIMQALWNWGGPPAVCRLWNLVYAALAWGVAQQLADQGRGIDLATIAGRTAFSRLMERQVKVHGFHDKKAARTAMVDQRKPDGKRKTSRLYGQQVPSPSPAVCEETAGYAVRTASAGAAGGDAAPLLDREAGAVTITVAGAAVRVVLAGGPGACVVTSYAG